MSLILGYKELEPLGIGRFDFLNIDTKWSADSLALSDVSVFAISVILLASMVGKRADIARKRRTAEGRTAKLQNE